MKLNQRIKVKNKKSKTDELYFTIDKYTKLSGSYANLKTTLVYICIDSNDNIVEIESTNCIFVSYM